MLSFARWFLPPIAPPAVRARRFAASLRRDLAAVIDGVRGVTPSPLVARPTRDPARDPIAPAPRASATAAAARELVVLEVRRETADAVTLVLADPNGAPIAFLPGQFVTLLVDLGGEIVRRAYSASSSYLEPARLAITIKRIAGGRVSNHLNDHARPGDRLRVLGPSGDFTITPTATATRHYVLLGGGSGITPLMAITRAVLATEPASRVTLVYGNRAAADIIFADELAALAAAHPALAIHHVLEHGDSARRGRLDQPTTTAILDAIDPAAAYFICGPEPMMDAVRAALLARGVDATAIHEERFSSPARRAAGAGPRLAQPVRIRVGAAEHAVLVPPGATLLDAGLDAGLPMPFSCAMGGCGACAVDRVSGELEIEEPNCLGPDERARGLVLACVARPLGPCTVAVRA